MRSLALLLVALTGLIAFEGCGSDSPPAQKPVAGTCSLATCPVPPNGKACCVGAYCGVDPGNGCVPNRIDAGAH
jgi:hypothetical protein